MSTYRISQLAERAGVRPTALRFYEQVGLLPAQRSPAGYRLYHEDAVERLAFIASGKHLGLPLEEIRELLAVWEDGLCADVRARLRPMLRTRIVEAEQRVAELDAFTDRLVQALAEIDGPPRPGGCDPGCGFLEHRHGSEAATVPLTLRRPEPAHPEPAHPEPTPVTCTLSSADQQERTSQWRRLLTGAPRELIDGGLRIQLPAEHAAAVAELAVAEQRCCAFFDFSLRPAGGGVQLEVRAPADARPVLAEIFGPLPDQDPPGVGTQVRA